jgi:hypothetical protein
VSWIRSRGHDTAAFNDLHPRVGENFASRDFFVVSRARILQCSRGPTPARSRSATPRLARAAGAAETTPVSKFRSRRAPPSRLLSHFCCGAHSRALSLGDFAPRSGRRRRLIPHLFPIQRQPSTAVSPVLLSPTIVQHDGPVIALCPDQFSFERQPSTGVKDSSAKRRTSSPDPRKGLLNSWSCSNTLRSRVPGGDHRFDASHGRTGSDRVVFGRIRPEFGTNLAIWDE